MKHQQSIHFLIPVRIRKKLETVARDNGITMSWVVRSLIAEHRNNCNDMPVFKRPKKFKEEHVRFSLKLYGDKEEILMYSKCNGGEFSPFIRYLLELWYHGKLKPNFDSLKTIKKLRKFKIVFQGIASIRLREKTFYKKHEYWRMNKENNLRLMNLGLSMRKHPLLS